MSTVITSQTYAALAIPVELEGNDESRLSRIDTLWSVVRRSHDDEDSIAISAQQQLVEIYAGAIRRYLLASLKDADLAEDLFQEFALKFVRGDFRNVDPAKGKFRHFVKAVIRNLIVGHHRKKSVQKESQLLGDTPLVEETGADSFGDDEVFLASWRDELLDQTWQALAQHETESGANYHTVLHLRVSRPALSSEEFAVELSEILGKDITAGTARTTLHRARGKFSNLMIHTIANSLEDPSRETVEAELVDLGLIDYCRETLKFYQFD